MSILKVVASARTEDALSREVARYLVQKLGEPVTTRDLVASPLPTLSPADLVAVHGSHHNGEASTEAHLALSETLINELRSATTLVIATPMYNFAVPSYLKQWIDYVCRAGVTFRYTKQGPEGLLNIDQAYLITATGGTPVGGAWDFASPYLEHVCRFLGIPSVIHIEASGSKGSRETVLAEALEQVDRLPALQARQS